MVLTIHSLTIYLVSSLLMFIPICNLKDKMNIQFFITLQHDNLKDQFFEHANHEVYVYTKMYLVILPLIV